LERSFLKAIQRKDLADFNKDNKLTIDEIHRFISDQAEGVPYLSRLKFGNSREQNPVLIGPGKDRIIVDY
jgi:hypothetical protein